MLLLFPMALLEIAGVGSWCLRLEEISAPRKERRTDARVIGYSLQYKDWMDELVMTR